MSDDEIWRTCSLSARCENAFRNMKSPLCERPMFYQLQSQQEPNVEVCRIVDPLLIENERLGQCAYLQQPVPVRRVSRQSRNLQTDNDTRVS